MKRIKVWDLYVRFFHWSLLVTFVSNAFLIDDDSKLHQYVGYFILTIVLIRIVWGFVGSKYARFASFPPSFHDSKEQFEDMVKGRTTIHIGHTPLGALMIYNLLFSILMICISGYLMTTDMFWGVEWPEEMHEFFVTWTEFSVLAHILAVIYESYRTKINLPKAMWTGYKEIPKE